MTNFIHKIRSLFTTNSTRSEPGIPDVETVIHQIADAESTSEVEPGRRFHQVQYGDLSLYLDLDITRTYRITIFRGNNRVYSFSVFCDPGDYELLKEGYEIIFAFLEGDRKLQELPENDRIKGYYFGE